MAKFCKNCGRALGENEVCNCTVMQNNEQMLYQNQSDIPQPNIPQPNIPQPNIPQPNMNGSYGAVPNQNAEKARTYLLQLFGLIKSIFKSPVAEGGRFCSSGNISLAMGLIAIQAISIALFLLSFSVKINSAMKMVTSRLGDIAQLSASLFPSATIFFVGLIVTFGIACLMAAVLMLFIKIFKHETSYSNMLCVSGINSIFTVPFILVALLISVVKSFNINIESASYAIQMLKNAFLVPIIVSCLGITLGNFASFANICSASSLTKDKSVYVMFLTGIVMSIALLIVIKIVYPMCLPAIAKTALDSSKNVSGILDSLF